MAAFALVNLQAVEPLIEALKHNDGRVRQEAAWALEQIGDSSSITPLSQQLIVDTDVSVQQAIQRALKKLNQIHYEQEW